jgi:DNA mismatch repair protein MSH2
MDDVSNRFQPEARRVAAKLDIEVDKKLKLEYSPQYGHHLRLSRVDANKIRGDREYIELRTQKAGILFTTTTLRRLSTDHTDMSKEYQKMSSSIAKEIVTITGTYFPVLERLNGLVAELDVYVSLAQVAVNAPIPFVRPVVSMEGDLILKGARHPCVEMQEDVSFIENDIELVDGTSMFHIITGPNMGGKSTFIRQVGVITLMAQMGSFVPCQEAHVRVVDAILARVGAGDSQLKGISTFMAEMLESASILEVDLVN